MPALLKPATPAQIAACGHIAAAVRDLLKARGWKPADLSEALGIERGSGAQVSSWMNAKGAPGPENRKKLGKLMGVAPDSLMRRDRAVAVVAQRLPAVVAAAEGRPRASDVLSFTVDSTGGARIRLDVTLPLEHAMPLVRLLLDAHLVDPEP